jgi:hypothetical protein
MLVRKETPLTVMVAGSFVGTCLQFDVLSTRSDNVYTVVCSAATYDTWPRAT